MSIWGIDSPDDPRQSTLNNEVNGNKSKK